MMRADAIRNGFLASSMILVLHGFLVAPIAGGSKAVSVNNRRNGNARSTFANGCEDTLCRSPDTVRRPMVVGMCTFGRLGPDHPAFAVVLTPKAGSSSIRRMLRQLIPGSFEASCDLYRHLPSGVAKKLNVTGGWLDIAVATPVRDPMDRFVSAWHELTRRANLGWMQDRLKAMKAQGVKMRGISRTEATELLQTPDVYKTFQSKYLEYVEEIDTPLLWSYGKLDKHLAPQLHRMGVCSEEIFKSRMKIRMEHMSHDLPVFFKMYAGATEEADHGLLEKLRNPEHSRPALASATKLDVAALNKESTEHMELWQRIRDSPSMKADYMCTGYSKERDTLEL